MSEKAKFLSFQRAGNFFTTFGEDAEIAGKIMLLAVTTCRLSGEKSCGIPAESKELHIYRLQQAGYTVELCDYYYPVSEKNA